MNYNGYIRYNVCFISRNTWLYIPGTWIVALTTAWTITINKGDYTMLIKDAIKQLQEYNENDEIIISWWDKDMFLDLEEFEIALENEDTVDWSNVHEQLTNNI